MKKDKLASPPPAERWTRIDDYLAALARRRTARRKRTSEKPRTQPQAPRFLLSTLPFIAMTLALAVMAVAIIVAAWPGSKRPAQRAAPPAAEQGTAARGWFEDAKREMR